MRTLVLERHVCENSGIRETHVRTLVLERHICENSCIREAHVGELWY